MRGLQKYKGDLYKKYSNIKNIKTGDLAIFHPKSNTDYFKYKGKYFVTTNYSGNCIEIPKEISDTKYNLLLKLGYNINYSDITLYKKVTKIINHD